MEDYFVEHILQYASNDDDLRKLPNIDLLTDYITNQWFENASIPQQIWNIFEREDDDRTNNCCECWHSNWNRKPGTAHPHIHK